MKPHFLVVASLLTFSTASLQAIASPALTTTALAVTASGSPVTTIASGNVITLTATVKAGSTVVTPGLVNFCDAAATYCTDIHILGSAQLTSAGMAVIRFVPGIGSHSYKAVFVGTTNDAASTSSAAALEVTGTIYPTATALIQGGSVNNYTLAATVGTTGNAAPTGSVSFLNTSDSNAVLAMSSLGVGTAGFSLFNFASITPSSQTFAMATGDFNGDGLLDVARLDVTMVGFGTPFNTVTVFLGDGHGNFTASVATATNVGPASGSISLAVADFNGDGKADLALIGDYSTTVVILLGSGDGSFTAAPAGPTVGILSGSIVTGDFNRDGNVDLAVLNNTYNSIEVLTGNGDGTFIAGPTTYLTFSPDSSASADFDGDGNADLVVSNSSNGSITVLLGDGQGNFAATSSNPPTGIGQGPIAVADFNGDGKADVAVANIYGNTVTVLLGIGDGTFAKVEGSLLTGNNPGSIAVADFNGDGKADLAISGSNPVVVLLGDGTGNFSPTAPPPPPAADSVPFAVGDLNGDGFPDVATPSAVLFAVTQTATTPATAVLLPPGAPNGISLVVASYPGDDTHLASTSPAISLTSQRYDLSESTFSSANPSGFGAPVTITLYTTASAAEYPIPTGTVTFLDGTTPIGTSPLVGGYQVDPTVPLGTATLTTSTLAVGSHTISVNYSGDANYNPLTSSLVQRVAIDVATPAFFPPAGPYSAAQTVQITSSTNGAVIHYTVDGTTPTNASPVYATALTVAQPTTIRAIAIAPAGDLSAVGVAAYTFNSIDFTTGFLESGQMQLNGKATLNASRLRLTDGGQFETGSAFYPTPVNIQNFITDFTFQISNPVADGFTFTIQNSSPTALGGDGAGLGFVTIQKSVAIKFDLYNNVGEGRNSTGLFTWGAVPTVPSIDLTGTGIDLHSGDSMAVHMTYDGNLLITTITDQRTKASWSHCYSIDIPGKVFGNTAYVGFTGGTGGGTSTQEILTWSYRGATIGLPNYPSGFNQDGRLVLNGDAALSGTTLELATGGYYQSGSVFYAAPLNIQGFSTDFTVQMNGIANGFTFCIQNSGPNALGGDGAGLGFVTIQDSLAIKFDYFTFDGEGFNSTGLFTWGALPTVPAIDIPTQGGHFNFRDQLKVHIAYDGTTLGMTILDGASSFTQSWPIDIPSTVFSNTAYVGFTGSTGGLTSIPTIYNWTYTPVAPTP